MATWHKILLRPQNVSERVDYLVRHEELTKHRDSIVPRRDSFITPGNHEPDPARGQSFGNRHRHPVSELHVQYGAVDGFLLDEGESLDSAPNRTDHDVSGLGEKVR